MKKVILALVLAMCGLFASDKIIIVNLDKILNSEDFIEILGNDAVFKFGVSDKNKAISTIHTHKKTSRSDKKKKFNHFVNGKQYEFAKFEKACGWVLLSNLKELKQQAQFLGGTKVVNIISYYKDSKKHNSNNTFLCAVGKMMVAMELKADILK